MKTKSTTQENSRPAPGRQILYIDGAGMGPDGTGSGYAVLNQTTGERWVGRKDSLTNNQAEYLALGLAVKRLPHGSAAEIRSDSEVVVKQFSGEYRVKVPQLKKLLRQIRDVIEERELDVTLRWIPREENLADALLRRQVAEARRELRNKRLYSEFFLSFGPPTWLVTITLEGDYTPGEDRFVAEVKEFLGQLKDDADDEFGWVLATDRGRLGKRLHGHLLIWGVEYASRKAWREKMSQRFGFSSIEKYDASGNAWRLTLFRYVPSWRALSLYGDLVARRTADGQDTSSDQKQLAAFRERQNALLKDAQATPAAARALLLDVCSAKRSLFLNDKGLEPVTKLLFSKRNPFHQLQPRLPAATRPQPA